MRQGFASPYWLTFKQALELGGNVRKGSKGTTIVYANKLVVKDSEPENERAIPFLNRYTGFNADKVEGLEGRQGGGEGNGVSVCVGLGGPRVMKKTKVR